jgi:hypothetical protein
VAHPATAELSLVRRRRGGSRIIGSDLGPELIDAGSGATSTVRLGSERLREDLGDRRDRDRYERTRPVLSYDLDV